MQSEVYARGEARVACDKIETVVVRERGRPRRPKGSATDEEIFNGEVVSDPEKVLEEIAVVVRKIVLAILLPAQAKPFLLERLLKSMEVRTFVIDQNAIEIKDNSPDLH